MLAVMSFLNNNGIGNTAMAQGYYDDKKYECRTGPFEGFFVISVEFCKQLNLIRIEKTLEIIEQGYKASQDLKVKPDHRLV